MIADILSRGCKNERNAEEFDTDDIEILRAITASTRTEAITEEKLRRHSEEDNQLKAVRKALDSGNWNDAPECFSRCANELCSFGEVVLRGQKIVIPQKLQSQILDISHEGHPGMSVMKRRIRAKYWWPGVDKQIEMTVDGCSLCKMVAQSGPAEPIKSTDLPSEAWEYVGADFLGPLPSGERLLLVVDYFSRYYEVQIMNKTDAEHVISAMRQMFIRLGCPKRIITDNGPPFNSNEFAYFCQEYGIKLVHSIPYQPRINGEVEIQNKSLVKAITISLNSGRDWKEDLQKFLFMQRTTPHSVTGIPPLELFLKRKIRDKLPSMEALTLPNVVDEELRDRDKAAKQKGKDYADQRFHHKESNLKAGDRVLVRRPTKTKWQSRNDPTQHTVIEKRGPALTLQSQTGKITTRDVSHVVKVGQTAPTESLVEPMEEEEEQSADEMTPLHDLASPQHVQQDDLLDSDFEQITTPPETGRNNAPDGTFAPPAASTPYQQKSRPKRDIRPPVWAADYIKLLKERRSVASGAGMNGE